MGSTVTCGKLAAAFKDACGRVLYAAFERAYEKNVYPHKPEWSCIAFGTYADVMRICFAYASACEGGMLQGTSGWMKPENYIVAWQRALAKPKMLHDQQIQLELSTRFSASMSTEKSELACAALAAIGRHHIWDEVAAGHTVPVGLYQDSDVLMALYSGENRVYPPWRILSHSSYFPDPQEDLAPKLASATVQPPEVELYSLEQMPGMNCLVGRIGDSQFRMLGSDYSVVGSFIENEAYQLEMQHAGCAKQLIQKFRDQCNTAPVLPPNTAIKVLCNVDGVLPYYHRKAKELANQLGVQDATSESELEEFSFKAGQITGDKELIYQLTLLSKEQVMFEMQD